MKNICIVCYYEIREALYEAKKSLEKLGYKIMGFPMYKYIHDVNEKIENYADTFINFINENHIDVVLWWFINIKTSEFKFIKDNTQVKYMLFNWDDPFNWNLCDLANKASYFDAVFITCKENEINYINNGTKIAHCLLPAFSPEIHNPVTNFNISDYEKYNCDISFCCTNLYETSEYNNQYIKRKKIVDDIYENQKKYDYTFHIYGPSFLKKKYADSYRGFINYNDLNKLFNYSKINLCTHVLCNADGYVNERVILIGGSGGLLLVDNVKGIDKYFEPNKDIYILDRENYVTQIVEILSNIDQAIEMRKSFNLKCNLFYTYDNWANFIHDKYLKNI